MKNLLLFFLFFPSITHATTYYVATNGNDANAGTITSPFKNWEKLRSVMVAGDIAYIRGGTYISTKGAGAAEHCLWSNMHGNVNNWILIQNYPGESPVFDLSSIGIPTNSDPTAVYVESCSYIHIKGLRVTGLQQNHGGSGISRGFDANNSPNCTFESIEVDHIGGGGFHLYNNSNDVLYLNCDAHHNDDRWSNPGAWGGADGFSITGGVNSTRTTYDGCRSWWNSDDGWDFYSTDGIRTLKNCWSFWNGYEPGTFTSRGNGNGFKLGPAATNQSANLLRILTNCVAFQNLSSGFDQNNGQMRYQLYNNTSFSNGLYGYEWAYYTNITQDFKNNIGYANGSANIHHSGNATGSNNTWNGAVTVSNADFLSVSSTGVDGPRQNDGSLPNLNFLKLAQGSDLIDAGVNVGLPYNGNAPDIGAFEYSSAANIPPTANAGSDQTITLPVNSVTLSGSGTDPDGTITAYLWTKISGPAAGNITNPNAAASSVTGLVQGIYNFELKVTDNNGAVGRDTMKVTVNPAANIPPTANAGSDQTITLPVNSVTLSGSGTDPDGTITAYLWTKISGPAAGNITNPNAASSSVTGLVQGIYNFELKVTDNNGAVGRDTMQVTVNPAANIPPTANAGSDQTITLPVNSVTLSGSGTDPDGTITAYLWTKISGPAAGNITNPNAAASSVTGLVQGIYNFELKVTDNNGAVGRDTMKVTVNPAANIPPTANAGSDQTITLPVNSVTLSGSGTDPDGTITAYLWTKISGPAAGNITNPNAAASSVTGLVQGIYNFELKVTDNNGAVGRDTMKVTVNPAANIPPTANAGSDQTITLPVNSVTLSGSGTDPDGTITAYLWTKISGPAAGNITNPNAASSSVTGLVQGIYNFELKVTDNNGAVGRDTMQVTVNPAANIPPTANAGSDQTITLPVNSVTLSGSGTDPDGTITAYLWTKISGPAAGNITNPNAAASSVTGLVQGIYNFELKVTDNNGAVGRDTMKVTVNPAANIPPTANAGSDQTITLPVNSVTLSGSGTDPDGTITAYLWTKISGPAAGNITNPNAAASSVTGLVQGIYNFELKVTDNNGAVGRDTMKVTVNPAANIPPTANAGADQTITLPDALSNNTVILSGSGTDPDGTITAYLWTKISGPAAGNITNPNAASTSVTGLVQGVYNFELKVTDNNGDVGSDVTKISLIISANIPPAANAGSDQTITFPNNATSLTGSGTDIDGTIVGYDWKQISGPSSNVLFSLHNAVTFVNNLLEGTYQFELTVTDNRGGKGMDTVSVVMEIPHIAIYNNSIKIYPNPVVNLTTLEITKEKVNTKVLMLITDMLGRTICTKELTSPQNNFTEKVNLSNLAKDIYLVTVFFDDTEKKTIKVIKTN